MTVWAARSLRGQRVSGTLRRFGPIRSQLARSPFAFSCFRAEAGAVALLSTFSHGQANGGGLAPASIGLA